MKTPYEIFQLALLVTLGYVSLCRIGDFFLCGLYESNCTAPRGCATNQASSQGPHCCQTTPSVPFPCFEHSTYSGLMKWQSAPRCSARVSCCLWSS